jgi:alkylhydroperoxidase family enzyme
MSGNRSGESTLNDGELQPDGGWSGSVSARLFPPKPGDRGLLFRSMSLVARSFGRIQIPDIFSVFHINARLFWAWLFFASKLMPGGRLPAKDREKIILRTAWNCRSRYEWGQHVDIALSVGVTDEEILKVARGPGACPDANERALLLACDEMTDNKYISDQTWATLSGRYDEKLLIEIVILIGHYIMIAGFLNSAGLRLESPVEEKLTRFHQRIAGLLR